LATTRLKPLQCFVNEITTNGLLVLPERVVNSLDPREAKCFFERKRGKRMGQPVKLSDQLVSDARSVAELSQRSIAGQIEFWSAISKSLEPLLRGDRALALRRSGAIRPLNELVAR
jgi:hypothetical protein